MRKEAVAVVTADWHIHPFQVPSRDKGLDRLRDGLTTLARSLELAKEMGVGWLCLGDMKHVRGVWDQRALAGILELFEHYATVPKLMLPGNGFHDGTGVNDSGAGGLAPFRAHSLVITEPQIVRFCSSLFAVWPWSSSLEAVDALVRRAQAAEARVLLGHGTFSGSYTCSGHRLDSGIPLPLFKLTGTRNERAFDMVLFGDIHKRQHLGDARQRSAAAVWYPGSPWAQNWGEREPQRGGLLLYREHDSYSVEPVNFDTAPRFIQADCSTWRYEYFGAETPSEWEGNFVRVLTNPVVYARLGGDKAGVAAFARRAGARHLELRSSGDRVVTARTKAATGRSSRTLATLLEDYLQYAEPPEGWKPAALLKLGLRLAEKARV